jgi:hypothetical protein
MIMIEQFQFARRTKAGNDIGPERMRMNNINIFFFYDSF